MTWRVDVVDEPQGTLITPVEAQAFANVGVSELSDDDRALWSTYLDAVRSYAEDLTGRRFLRTTLEWVGDTFPTGPLVLPDAPLAELVSVSYRDDAGADAQLAPERYRVSQPRGEYAGRATLHPLSTWPTTDRSPDNVRVRHIAGYATLPARARLAVLKGCAAVWGSRDLASLSVMEAELRAYRLPTLDERTP